MTTEEELRLKLREIEALFEGAGTSERGAAGVAIERVKKKLAQNHKGLNSSRGRGKD